MPRYLQISILVGVVIVAVSMLYALVLRPEVDRWRLDNCLRQVDDKGRFKSRFHDKITGGDTQPDELCFRRYPVR